MCLSFLNLFVLVCLSLFVCVYGFLAICAYNLAFANFGTLVCLRNESKFVLGLNCVS